MKIRIIAASYLNREISETVFNNILDGIKKKNIYYLLLAPLSKTGNLNSKN